VSYQHLDGQGIGEEISHILMILIVL